MSEQLKQLMQMAARIKMLREVEDVSVETISNEIGVTANVLRIYETGKEDLPVSVLISIAN